MTSRHLYVFLLVLVGLSATAQDILVSKITITGNTKTKEHVIRREILIQEDSAYTSTRLKDLIAQSENRVLNLNLFNTVNITRDTISDRDFVTLEIVVVEKWYIWPIPFVEFSDRNFNVWGGLDFDPARTNYGLYVFNYNLFGRNHTLKTKMKTGYHTKLGVEYRIPFLSSKTQWGLNTLIEYAAQNEVWYQTRNDSLQFFKNGKNNLIKTLKSKVEFSKRINPFSRIYIGASYENGQLDTSVPTSDYFSNSTGYQNTFGISLGQVYDTRDNIFYPIAGKFLSLRATAEGWKNIDWTPNLEISTKIQYFKKLRPKISTALAVFGTLKSNPTPPYSRRQVLGYNQIVRGFEYYVIDGTWGYTGNAAIRYQLLHKPKLKINLIPFENYKVLPLNIYAEAYVDVGQAGYKTNDPSNQLNGEFLYAGGLGLNVLLYNDRLLRLEYSLNSLQEGGFFVHFKKAI